MISTIHVIPAQTIAAFAHQSYDIIEHQTEERDAKIIITLNEIQELKNRQAWTEQIIYNLLSRSIVKPGITCTPTKSS
jgi:Cdc6-like AAA superfamily ATPase